MGKAQEGSKYEGQQVCSCSEMNMVEEVLSFSVVGGSFSINVNALGSPVSSFLEFQMI